MSAEFVNVEVNGVAVKAPKGAMIIRVTDANGAYVPRFCYHDKLPIAANCRMCLVEVEKVPKPLPACATPVTEGMKIFTRSPRAIAAQKATMEFLLINHPLDCPICDQGGECELQDLAVGFGRDISRYTEQKRVVVDQNLGPLVSTDMTRCILCTRCVRFGQDIAGLQELGTTGRGEHMQIGTYIERSVDHELSGNIIDLCPVGALNSKPFRFRARAWEMTQHALVSAHDGFGTRLYGHVLRGRLMRVVPQPCEEINETWIPDRDRYSYEGLYSEDRLTAPRVRGSDGSWQETDWDTALTAMAEGLKGAAAQGGGVPPGFLAQPSSTLEELYLLARIAQVCRSANIDHRLRQRDFRDQESDAGAPGLGQPLAEVDALDALFIVGSNLRAELPMLAHRVRKAALRGARISLLNPENFTHLFPVETALCASPAQMVRELGGVLLAAVEADAQVLPEPLVRLLAGASATDSHRAIARSLITGRRAIWLGALASRHYAYAELRQLARELARITGAKLGELLEGANAVGAYHAGCLPHRERAGRVRARPGLSARQMLERPLPGYLLLGTEPWADSLEPLAFDTLERAGFVGAINTHVSAQLLQVASVLLPAAAFAETAGTFVNLEGRWQSFSGAALPPGAARPAWKILRVLGNLLQVPDCDYQSSEQVRDELRAAVDAAPQLHHASQSALSVASAVESLRDVPMYQIDALLRRAPSLQATRIAQAGAGEYRS
ncbi:MAG TPA: NADH-quinone oxidoreductase subunit NuoG [Steroidobacteraceae bacterium]|nr:NADH-quinone oxidoreductase subunit NuoG [Steroidobacteraceae bacterium]